MNNITKQLSATLSRFCWRQIKDLNEILLRVVPNGWGNQFYLKIWYFEVNTYKGTCDIFEDTEISDQVYEVGTTYKITNHRTDANSNSHGSKHKVG